MSDIGIIYNINPLPIFVHRLEESEQINNSELKIIKLLEYKEKGTDNENLISYEANLLKKYKELNRLKKIFRKYVNHFTQDILGLSNKFKNTQSWITKTQTSESHPAHWHPNAMIGLSYYFSDIDAQNTDFAKLVFQTKGIYNIFPEYKFDYRKSITKCTDYNAGQFSINILPHHLVIFPCNLIHMTTDYMGDITRYMLGSNYFISGQMGEVLDTTQINLKIKT